MDSGLVTPASSRSRAEQVGEPIRLAIRRARGPIVASGVTYLAFVILGIALATAGWPPAVEQRDSIVNGAQSNPITQAYHQGDRWRAAWLDFGANIGLGAIPTSIAGLSVVGPFPIAAYRGWVGGIVSIDGRHQSRLSTPGEAAYYLVTLVLQLVGFVLTMGAGVHVGLSVWRARNDSRIRSVLGLRIPAVALRDAGWIYVAAIPFFFVGSLWEFLAQA
ncbi:MAG TPA: hypothetical protein VFL27_14825 [Candidatus Dormibacteraeota bacterium]|nr:hypothetical protein [Candidatus Dormibacteraeota bacterium]